MSSSSTLSTRFANETAPPQHASSSNSGSGIGNKELQRKLDKVSVKFLRACDQIKTLKKRIAELYAVYSCCDGQFASLNHQQHHQQLEQEDMELTATDDEWTSSFSSRHCLVRLKETLRLEIEHLQGVKSAYFIYANLKANEITRLQCELYGEEAVRLAYDSAPPSVLESVVTTNATTTTITEAAETAVMTNDNDENEENNGYNYQDNNDTVQPSTTLLQHQQSISSSSSADEIYYQSIINNLVNEFDDVIITNNNSSSSSSSNINNNINSNTINNNNNSINIHSNNNNNNNNSNSYVDLGISRHGGNSSTYWQTIVLNSEVTTCHT